MASSLISPVSVGCLKRKTSGDDDAGIPCKHIRYILEPPSDSCSSFDVESIYSWQDRETASARDTADTDEHEFDPESLSEVTCSEVSSGPEKCVIIGNFDAIVDEFGSEISYIADLSDSFSDDEEKLRRMPQKQCEKCKAPCDEPFTLCLKCFKQRRTFQPPRPKGKGRRKTKSSSHRRVDSGLGSQGSSEGSLGSQGSQGSLQRQESLESHGSLGSQESHSDDAVSRTENSQQGSTEPKVCKCCFARPVNGAFIHKNSVHTLYCYECSIKQWRMRGRCPFCNQKLNKVAKIFPVED